MKYLLLWGRGDNSFFSLWLFCITNWQIVALKKFLCQKNATLSFLWQWLVCLPSHCWQPISLIGNFHRFSFGIQSSWRIYDISWLWILQEHLSFSDMADFLKIIWCDKSLLFFCGKNSFNVQSAVIWLPNLLFGVKSAKLFPSFHPECLAINLSTGDGKMSSWLFCPVMAGRW